MKKQFVALALAACAQTGTDTTDAVSADTPAADTTEAITEAATTEEITTVPETEEETIMGKKYFTLSFDDGIEQDARFIELLKKYSITCCTFNINTGLLGQKGNLQAMLGKYVEHNKITRAALKDGFYSGYEVAVHTLTHPALTNCTDAEIKNQVTKDAANIEKLVGVAPVGMAYPGGNYYNDHIISLILENSDLRYARTVTSTYNFNVPTRFMEWNPTICASDTRLMSVARQFLSAEPGENEALLFYVWGHTYEFDFYESWDAIEQFLSYMSGHDDVEYVTNAQFYELFNDVIPS